MSAVNNALPQPRTLNEWRDWLCEEEIPVFSNTIQRINEVIDKDETGATELARIIMEDTNLTAKILRMGNSVHYNPTGQSVATLTRATVILGTKLIHELAVTCTFIEAMRSARNKKHASEEIARSLHAATQARSLALLMRDPSPEEVFVATLLLNIGHIAFSCFEEAVGDEIETVKQRDGLPAEKAEKRVLGFTLHQLGAAMSKAWRLAGLTEEVFSGRSHHPARVQLVKQCNALARAAEKDGWDGADARKIIQDLARMIDKPLRATLDLAKNNAKAAADIASQLGADEAARLIPVATPNDSAKEAVELASDPQTLLIRIHQDITNLLSGKFNINVLFELIIESIHRGLGMDHTFFAMVSPDRKLLKEKSSHGWTTSGGHFPIQIELTAEKTNLLIHALTSIDALWARPDKDQDIKELFTHSIQAAVGMHECFLIPLSLNGKPIGLIYADRASSGKAMDQESFNHFRQLGQQAMIGLRLASFKD